CRCGEMADAQDLKSWDRKKSCEFESHHRHQPLPFGLRLGKPAFARSEARAKIAAPVCRAEEKRRRKHSEGGLSEITPHTDAASVGPASQLSLQRSRSGGGSA